MGGKAIARLCALVCALGLFGAAPALAAPANTYIGTYEGTHNVNNQRTPLTLTIEQAQGANFTGYVIENLSGAPVRVPVTGQVDANSRATWIKRYNNGATAQYSGNIARNEHYGAFSGAGASGRFSLRRDPRVPTIAVPDEEGLRGAWEISTTCDGQPRDIAISVGRNIFGTWGGANSWGTMVYYRGPQQGEANSIVSHFHVSGVPVNAQGVPAGDTIVMMPTGGYNDLGVPIVFQHRNGRWSGVLQDSSCAQTNFARPGPRPVVSASGAPVSGDAWLGRSPLSPVGGRTLFDYMGYPPATALTASERAMQWTPVVKANTVANAVVLSVGLSAYTMSACAGGDCATSPSRRVFAISGNVMHFASAIGANQSQVCIWTESSPRWFCHRLARAFPHQMSNSQLAQWMWDTVQREDAAWRREHPLPPPNCRTVYQYDRDGPHSPRSVCDPPTPRPDLAKPNSPRL